MRKIVIVVRNILAIVMGVGCYGRSFIICKWMEERFSNLQSRLILCLPDAIDTINDPRKYGKRGECAASKGLSCYERKEVVAAGISSNAIEGDSWDSPCVL